MSGHSEGGLQLRASKATHSAPSALSLENLRFSYGPMPVLFGVSFAIAAGEAVALVGTNGAGKSTILRLIAGLERPDAGRVVFDGRDVTGMGAEELARCGVALVRGGIGVFADLTVAENLELQAAVSSVARRSSAEAQERALEVFPALAGKLRLPAGRLSGGERQQLALAKAIVGRPRLLCIDELSLGLSAVTTDTLLEHVGAINAAGVPVLLVEQSLEIAAAVCARAVFIEKGEVRFDGPSRRLLKRRDLLRPVFMDGPE